MNLQRAAALAAISVAMCAPHSAVAQQGVITNPDWLRRPSPDELWRVAPSRAAKEGKSGSARIACQVNADGGLFDCRVDEETPPGYGFGAAGLALAPNFRMRPMMVDGKPVAGGTVRIPMNWKIDAPIRMLGLRVLADLPWRKAPDFEQVAAAYPERGRKEKVSGRAVIRCAYTRAGRLKTCDVMSQTPVGYGFGSAAKSLAQYFEGPPIGDDVKEKILAQVNVAFPAELLDGKRRIGKADWGGLPTADDVQETYPAAAEKARLAGKVLLNCDVGAGGAVVGCIAKEETPTGQGFGDAAVRISKGFRMNIWTDEGLPTVGGKVTIPITYQPGTPPPPAKP